MPTGQKFLTIYAGALTCVFAATLLFGFSHGYPTDEFDEITVHRINVVEPDGTLRMVISNKDRLPGIIVKGEERPFTRPQAGMLFYNDEGSENGGLVFSGRLNADGEVTDSGGSLSFDKYGANQIVQLAGVDDHTDRFAGLIVSDDSRRIWVGRNEDGNAMLSLMDADGRPRIRMEVEPDGTSSLSFLDAEGKIVRNIR
jgi:hypothetical protein